MVILQWRKSEEGKTRGEILRLAEHLHPINDIADEKYKCLVIAIYQRRSLQKTPTFKSLTASLTTNNTIIRRQA